MLQHILGLHGPSQSISNGNRLSLVQIQGVIRRVIYTLSQFEIMSLITAESHDMKSCYQLIVLMTKCENLSLGILPCFCFGIFLVH